MFKVLNLYFSLIVLTVFSSLSASQNRPVSQRQDGDIKQLLCEGILLVGCSNGDIKYSDVDRKKDIFLRGHKAPITCFCVLPGGRLFASGAADGSIRIWNSRSKKSIVEVKHQESIMSLESGDGQILVAIDKTDSIVCVDIFTGKLIKLGDSDLGQASVHLEKGQQIEEKCIEQGVEIKVTEDEESGDIDVVNKSPEAKPVQDHPVQQAKDENEDNLVSVPVPEKMVAVKGQNGISLQCPECQKLIRGSPYNLELHRKTHYGVYGYTCTFPGCGHKFRTKDNLKKHVKIHIKEEKPVDPTVRHDEKGISHQCSECKKFIRGTFYNLRQHISVVHRTERPFACTHPGCDERRQTEALLKKHLATHDPEKKKFICDICGVRKISGHALREHMNTHKAEKAFQCTLEGCTKAFNSKSALNLHLKDHSGENYFPCTVEGCDKFFTRNRNLKRHIETVHQEHQENIEGGEDE